MTTVGQAYVVRAAGTGPEPGEVTQVYPYTLQGLTRALEEARFRSFGDMPQVVAIMTGGKSRVIRRFEDGHEVPVTPLPSSRRKALALNEIPWPRRCPGG
jgi:hypothetical protein